MVKYVALLILCASACYAAPSGGVLVQERVIKLPEDGAKWHISVVGSGDRYQEILAWFKEGKLSEIRGKVHFHEVSADSDIYKERYKSTVKGLPTVRVQDANGVVLFEESKNLPMSGDGLYSQIAAKVNGSEELLPWRRKHSQPVQPIVPDVTPDTDPEPAPLDDGAEPVFEDQFDWEGLAPAICVVLFLFGAAFGQVESLKAYRKSRRSGV